MEKTIHNPVYGELIQWLSQKRATSGFTIRDLADTLGWHHSALGRIETLERRLDMLEYVKLCDALGCDPHEGLQIVMRRSKQS